MKYQLPNIVNKDIFNITSPNIIFYGHQIKLNDYLIQVFGETKTVTREKIIYQNNHVCKIFDIDIVKSKNIDDFFNVLFEIIRSENYYSKFGQHIVIFNNYNHISQSIQNKLRVIIEKYRKTTQFIMITEKINTIINPIKSRCLCIRIPNMSMKEKRDLSRTYLKDKSYEERIPIYNCIYSLNDKDDIIKYSEYNEYIENHENIYLKIYKKLNEWLDEWINNDNINLSEIKEYSYNILKYSLSDIHFRLYTYFIKDPKYTLKQKKKLTDCISKCEHEFSKSYRSLVHIESMFIELIHLLA
jgi:DNA polymerase III delta prime subunit